MQVESPAKIRNLAVTGHNDSGKTTLISALLYTSGVSNRLQTVEDGNTITDFDPEEAARGFSIGLAPCFAPWQGHKINLVDCPGKGIFYAEAQSGVRATDAVLMCINAASGVEVNTERVWNYAEKVGSPVIFHLTQMDRERASLESTLESIDSSFGRGATPVQIPIGKEADFAGVVDLIHQKATIFERDGDGKGSETEIPAELTDTVEEWRDKLIEAVAEADDALLEKFFEEGTLSQEDLESGLRKAVLGRKIFPVTVSSALHGIGSAALLDTLITVAPSPEARGTFPATNVGDEAVEVKTDAEEPFSALVFKTLSDPFSGKITLFRVVSGTLTSDTAAWNTRDENGEKVGHLLVVQGKTGTQVDRLLAGDIGGLAKLKHTHTGDTLCVKERPVKLAFVDFNEPAISYALEPKAKGDEEKIGDALHRLMEEDPTLKAGRDPETHEFLLSGTGQLHIEIAVAKIKSRFKTEVILHPPKIPYRETIRKAADGHGRHKKQSGGRGQFADCKIKMEPLERGEDFEFKDEIFGGSIPQGFRPAVEKGIQEARVRGFHTTYPVVDFRIRLLDGQYHDVDSSEMAFKVAGSLAFKDAMEKAAPTIIEPMMQVEVTTSEEFMGDIMGDLSQRRGRPQGMEVKGDKQVVKAVVPMAEMLDYSQALRSMTQGRARYHMEYSHYEEVPRNLQEKIIAECKKEHEES